MLKNKALAAAPAAVPQYIEDVFSTYLYTGNGFSQTITNGIDLAGQGGLVWTKARTNTNWHSLTDTVTGANKILYSHANNTQDASPSGIGSFGASGYSFSSAAEYNQSTINYVSWTFRRAPKFFDVVAYTGNGNADQALSHSLGATPGCMIIKATSATGDWWVWHRSYTNVGENQRLNLTNGIQQGFRTPTAPSATTFTVSGNSTGGLNVSGISYVAYLFAHDAGGFGDAGDQNVVSCGSFTTDASGNATVNLGWEPQYLMIKASATASDWYVMDTMRGSSYTSYSYLSPNLSAAETSGTGAYLMRPTATGFDISGVGNSRAFIYLAIRRGPMKTPESGTEVFDALTRTGTGTTATVATNISPVDSVLSFGRSGALGTSPLLFDRLRGATKGIFTGSTGQESTLSTTLIGFDVQNGYRLGADSGGHGINYQTIPFVNYAFRRAPGFFDVVCYTGTGVARTVNHNLGVAPELIIVKSRSVVLDWLVYSAPTGATQQLKLNSNEAAAANTNWNNTAPTSTVFSVSNGSYPNGVNYTYVAYLFATLPGVSKVGSYTGTGTTQQINCGFTTGARFVLIKRTDSTGNWYVWDTARGISTSNDPYLLLNSAVAEVTNTDYIDPLASGFEISSTAPAEINANGGTFIYLAIA